MDENKRKEKEKILKEEPMKRPEKDVKKTESISIKKAEPSVSPKKQQITALPVTRHRVITNLFSFLPYLLFIFINALIFVRTNAFNFQFSKSLSRTPSPFKKTEDIIAAAKLKQPSKYVHRHTHISLLYILA